MVSVPIVRWWVVTLLISVLVLGTCTVARAQTSADAQYSSPTDTASGNPSVAGFSADNGTSDPSGSSSFSSDPAGGGSAGDAASVSSDVLPSTGGPLLPLVALGALTLGACGLVVIQRLERR